MGVYACFAEGSVLICFAGGSVLILDLGGAIIEIYFFYISPLILSVCCTFLLEVVS